MLFITNHTPQPLPYETLDVRREAERLLESINAILQLDHEMEHAVITQLKRKIEAKLNEERRRQQRYGLDSNRLLSDRDGLHQPQIDGDASGLGVRLGAEGREELEHEMALRDHVHEVYENHVGGDHEVMVELNVDIVVDFWHSMELLVMAATRLSLSVDPNDSRLADWFIVHGLAKTGCPHEIAHLAVKLYPNQVRQRDYDGNLPLHIAASSHKTSALADGTWHHNRQHSGDHSNSVPSMLKCLLEIYPGAAKESNAGGRYSINLAIMAGKTWSDGVGDIFKACPNVVLSGSLDMVTNLPSFMLAALARDPSTYDDVGFEEEMRAKRRASKKIGSMWRFFPAQSKRRALEEAKSDIELLKLSTIFELLKAVPEFIRNP